MRIWQKLYMTTLILFLLMLNAGLFLAAGFIFSYNLTQEQKKAENDCYFLCQNLEHDFSILQQNSRYQDNIVKLLFESYQSYYSTQDISLSLVKTEKKQNSTVSSNIKNGGRQMEIFAEHNLGKPYETYRIQYRKRLTSFEKTWRRLKQTFAVISLSMSVLLCPLLYLFMRRVLKPLGKLNENVAKIAAGEYEKQPACQNNSAWNKDEIAELSQNISIMANTIQRQISALEEENSKKQQLMDNLAHELKTPLTSIYGYAEYLLYAKTTPKETYEGLGYIMEESRRLSKMSETMLSMRIYEKEETHPAPVKLEALASHVEKILSHSLQQKKLTLEKHFDLALICGDETMLVNLLRNLLENAIRASRIQSKITWNCYQKNGCAVMEIIDRGIGMEQNEIDHITEAFYRVDKARARKDGGVGLGLSVADLIVRRMNGTMAFSSAPGAGTKVTVSFGNFTTS